MSGRTHHDDHGHDHDHAGGLKGIVTAIFAPHSHDAADSIDRPPSSRQNVEFER